MNVNRSLVFELLVSMTQNHKLFRPVPKRPFSKCVCVRVWSSVGNGGVPVGPAVRLVHPIKAPLPPQRAMWRGFGEARCPTIAGSDYRAFVLRFAGT